MPRNPITGSLDVNDMTVYTGFAEVPMSEVESYKLFYSDDSSYKISESKRPVKEIVYGIVKKKDGSFFFLEGHDHYFFDKESIGMTNDVAECKGEVVAGEYVTDQAYKLKIETAIQDTDIISVVSRK